MQNNNYIEAEESNSLEKRALRKVYLVTYSQADESKCSNRERFGELVIEAFDPKKESTVQPKQWAVSKEPHKQNGFHYHMCVKFNNNKRWNGAKRHLLANYGISVHFSDSHQNYLSAYRYVTKQDKDVYHSPGHPHVDITTSPQTSSANKALMRKRRSKSSETAGPSCSKTTKVTKLSKVDVMDLIQSRGIKTDTDLLALGNELSKNGCNSLKAFIANTPERVYRELISKAWKFAEAPQQLERQTQDRLERLRECSTGDCVSTCQDKLWLSMAKEVLRNNKINAYVFADAVRTLLELGRGKGRNILLIGPTNCAKTFLLDPLTEIYDSFSNPASNKFFNKLAGGPTCSFSYTKKPLQSRYIYY